MTFTFWSPPQLRPEQVNPMSALITRAMDTFTKGLKISYLPKQLETELEKAQLYNKFYGPNIESQMNLRNAQTGLTNQQAQYYGPNMESQLGLRGIQKQLYESQAAQASAQARKMQMMMDLLSNPSDQNSGGDNPIQNDQNGFNNASYQPLNVGDYDFENPENFQENTPARQISEQLKNNPSDKAWGVHIPKPTKQDLQNKFLFGIDSYSPNRNQAFQNQSLQQKGYLERSLQANNESTQANQFNQLLDRYNNVMDKTLLSGPYGSKLPIPTSNRQEIEYLSNEMRLGGVERLRHAMGNARFSNLDMQVASTLKPDITWSEKARKFYTQFMKATNKRISEKAQFYRIASDPRMGIPYNVADSLWSSYQQNHPIVQSQKDEKLNEYKKNNWMSYLTHRAIKAIQEKGDYNPRDKGFHEPEKTINGKVYKKIKGQWYEIGD